MKRLFILIAALILAVNSAYALPRNVALRNAGNQAGYERLVRGLEPTLWLATDEGITVSGSNVTQWDSKIGSISFTQGTAANQPLLSTSGPENLITYSEDFENSAWNKAVYPSSVSGNTVTATAGSARHGIYQVLTANPAIAGQSYRQSVEIEKGNHQYLVLGDNGDAVWHVVTVDMNAGTITNETNVTNSSIETVSTDRYIVTWEFTRTNAGAMDLIASFGQTDSDTSTPVFNAAGTETFKIYTAQHQRANLPPSYLATTNAPIHGSTTGRKGVVLDGSDDILSSSSTLDDAVNNNAKEVFIVAEAYAFSSRLTMFADVGGYFRIANITDHFEAQNWDGAYDTLNLATASVSTPYVINVRHDGTNLEGVFEGTEATVASGNTTTMTAALSVGHSSTAHNGAIYEIITFDKVLSDNQRQAIIEGLESKYRID